MSRYFVPHEYRQEHAIYSGMKERCYRKKHPYYKNYGGRGIKVCDRWLEPGKGFANFLDDMGKRPGGYTRNGRPLYTLDRIDTNGDYCPENCRWATVKEQCRNKRNNVVLTFQGETHCVTEWAEKLGINRSTIYMRIHYGYETKDVLSTNRVRHKA